jgi:hypothetical protein
MTFHRQSYVLTRPHSTEPLGHFSLIPTGFRRKLLWPTNLPIVARLGTRPVPSR